MKNPGSRGSIFIYAILLANFALIVAYIIFSSAQELVENRRYSELGAKLSKNIEEKADSAFDYASSLNNNGSGFTDTKTCPSVSMSGSASSSTYTETIVTSPFFDGTSYSCSGASTGFPGKTLKLTYNPTYSSFSGVSFLNIQALLTGTSTLTATLPDTDATVVTMSNTGALSSIDANANSDDCRYSSTGTLAYPDNKMDDDDLARKLMYGYVRNNSGWKLIYWNTPTVTSYIHRNLNNTGSLALFPDSSVYASIYLDADAPFSIKIVEFDSGSYLKTKDLRPQSVLEKTFTGGQIGYLQNDLSFFSGSTNALKFDLKSHNYGIFLSGTGADGSFLRYQFSMKDPNGTPFYINALDDSDANVLKYLGNDIIIDSENHFSSKEYEVTREAWHVGSNSCAR